MVRNMQGLDDIIDLIEKENPGLKLKKRGLDE
jgi:hypothetical protein